MCKFNTNCTSSCTTRCCKTGNVYLPQGENAIVFPNPATNTWWVNGVDTGEAYALQGDVGNGITSIVDNGNGTWTINYTNGSSEVVNAPAAAISIANTGGGLQLYNTASGSVKNFRTVKPKGFLYGIQGANEIELKRQDSLYHDIIVATDTPAIHYVRPTTGGAINASANGKAPSNAAMTGFVTMRPYDLNHHVLKYDLTITFTPPDLITSDDNAWCAITLRLNLAGNINAAYWKLSTINTDPLYSGDIVVSEGSANTQKINTAGVEETIAQPTFGNDIQTQFYSISVDAESYEEVDFMRKHLEKTLCSVLLGSPQNETFLNLTGFTAPALTGDNFLTFYYMPVGLIGREHTFKCRGSMFVTNEYKYV